MVLLINPLVSTCIGLPISALGVSAGYVVTVLGTALGVKMTLGTVSCRIYTVFGIYLLVCQDK